MLIYIRYSPRGSSRSTYHPDRISLARAERYHGESMLIYHPDSPRASSRSTYHPDRITLASADQNHEGERKELRERGSLMSRTEGQSPQRVLERILELCRSGAQRAFVAENYEQLRRHHPEFGSPNPDPILIQAFVRFYKTHPGFLDRVSDEIFLP